MQLPRIGIIELLLKYYKLDDIISTSSSNLELPGNIPKNVFDFKNKNKRLETNRDIKDSFFSFTLKNISITVSHYRIRSANEKENQSHLKNWTLYGSNDNNIWTLIDRRTDITSLNGPLFSSIFMIDNPKGPFSTYKINETESYNFPTKIMFSEIDLYDNFYQKTFLYYQCTLNKHYSHGTRFLLITAIMLIR